MTHAQGGFFLIKEPLIKGDAHQHTCAVWEALSIPDITALNHAQATRWRINSFILDTQRKAFADQIPLPAIPIERSPLSAIPVDYMQWRETIRQGRKKFFSDEMWESFSDDERTEIRQKLAKAHSEGVALVSQVAAFTDRLAVAEELRNEASIFMPHNKDFRGRIYPTITSGPHPQLDDAGRALLHFSGGKRLGELGYYWLLVHAANSWGFDKAPLDLRACWALDHRSEMIAASRDPFEDAWWREADAPWTFLATCHELAIAWQSEAPENFVSHLPVSLDGTCNGLQHLSAMVLDPKGARATNLSASETRNDIYVEVGRAFRTLYEKQVADDAIKQASYHDRIDDERFLRDFVKRGVMTTPYGVTAKGLEDQLLNSDCLSGEPAEKRKEAREAARLLTDALEEQMGPARVVMKWLGDVAENLAKAELPFTWRTPLGSTIQQAYRKPSINRVSTLLGQLHLQSTDPTLSLNPKKQRAGASPNFIHSFDAAHMSMTVNLAYERGVRDFALVHDSFGTHAADVEILARALRETFVQIYETDQLKALALDVTRVAPSVAIPDIPRRGAFDIHEVLKAPFFFS
ncbi:hypothetical protein N5W20_05505 [Candidatus Kirkpatrickella diaphorinae]|uniref:DNA-directed RNA polymerase n=1 Tax=Candidatus Kirkpatrickella diaphorinae TaxID=2984322 RepID=A0ABY6GGF2_9PROT|nr:DNA-directed RNA polymerase [Candidatus Kirkpatrickella diaphorinae]UYH50585.1 hypothetical protein N5W20_05505 [Candidatus Kirkpatrickella diaphorinae]